MSFVRAISVGSLLILAAVVAGCSDLYTDRRDKISVTAGDAIATNKMTHMVDPWPRHSANRNIAFNGEKMQTAVERYRTDRVTAPVNATTSSTQYQRVQPVVLSTSGKP
jgi:hypothetical protein